jgi:hypothetical protein
MKTIGKPFKKGCIPWNKGKKMPEVFGKNLSKIMIGQYKNGERVHHFLGKKRPEMIGENNPSKRLEAREKISKARKGIKNNYAPWNKGLRLLQLSGENHWNWKGGISKNVHSVDEPNYKEWRKRIFKRDNYKCRMDKNCKSYIQAHHILPWRDYPELRYEINNGITLCLAHHPRKRAEEKRLAPLFMELVSVSN